MGKIDNPSVDPVQIGILIGQVQSLNERVEAVTKVNERVFDKLDLYVQKHEELHSMQDVNNHRDKHACLERKMGIHHGILKWAIGVTSVVVAGVLLAYLSGLLHLTGG